MSLCDELDMIKQETLYNGIKLPTCEMLDEISFETSIGKSTNKLVLNQAIVDTVKLDARIINNACEDIAWLGKYDCRVKTPDSIDRKVERKDGLRFQSVFNDIIGIRMKVKEYPSNFPAYYRVVDLRNGKKVDDGYRAIHLYYIKSNFHYAIEIQLWKEDNYQFNSWVHTYAYKMVSSSVLKNMRSLYDNGKITCEEDFLKEVDKYVRSES